MRPWRRSPAGPRRGVAAVFATVLMVGLTVTAGVILWSFRVHLPSSPVSITYIAQGDQSEPAWGDPTDCKGSDTGINATCLSLPAIFIIVTGHQPADIPVSAVSVNFLCNGTSLLNGSLQQLEIVPGTGANPGVGSPKLGSCGTWSPSPVGHTASYFNRLAYFQQIQPSATVVKSGDMLVVYKHPPVQFTDYSGNANDKDDFHGAPWWCFSVAGACSIQIAYNQYPPQLLANIPVTQLQG